MMTADERLSHEAWLSVIDKAISDIEEYHQRMINEGRYSRFNTEEMGQQRLDAMMDVRQSIVWNKAQGNLPIEIARQHAELMRQRSEERRVGKECKEEKKRDQTMEE